MEIIFDDVCGITAKAEIANDNQFREIDFEELGAYNFGCVIDQTNLDTLKFSYRVINAFIQKGFKVKAISPYMIRFCDDSVK